MEVGSLDRLIILDLKRNVTKKKNFFAFILEDIFKLNPDPLIYIANFRNFIISGNY